MADKNLIQIVEDLIQKRINQILQNNEMENYDKLPGLVESLKIIKKDVL